MMNAILMPANPDQNPLVRILKPAVDPRTLLRALHLLLMLPLGVAYFTFFVTAFALGGSLIWTFVGPAVLVAAIFASRWLGDLETEQVRWVTGTHIQRPPWRLEGVETFRERMKVRLIDPTTWTGLAYLVLQLAVGTATFSAVVVLVSTAAMFTAAPLITPLTDEPIDFFGMTLNTAAEAAPLVPVGLLLFVASAHAIVGMSNLHARWARLMLGSRARKAMPAPLAPGDGPGPGHPEPSPVILAPIDPENRLRSLAEATQGPWQDPGVRDLTPREREVLILMARGYSNAEIAEAFVLSEGTVKTHVKRVLAKLPARDRTQAAVLAHEKGLLSAKYGAGAGPEERNVDRAG